MANLNVLEEVEVKRNDKVISNGFKNGYNVPKIVLKTFLSEDKVKEVLKKYGLLCH